MIKSKFNFWVLLPVVLLPLITFFLYGIVTRLVIPSEHKTPVIIYFGIILFTYLWIWMFFGELRTKAITVFIDEKLLCRRNFLGLGPHTCFDLSDFEGFITCQLPSKGGTYEFLYLVKNGKKVVKLSEFYHRNYPHLKQRISKTCKFLGDQPFSMLREVKEIFI